MATILSGALLATSASVTEVSPVLMEKGAAMDFSPLRPVTPQTQDDVSGSSDQTEVVKLHADLVTVVVTVASPKGKIASDLHEKDFEILEDGVPQFITSFSRHSQVPLSLVMIFDASLSIKRRLKFQKSAVARFLRTIVRPIDHIAILSVGTDVVLRQDFTSDMNRLLRAVSHLDARGATALYDGIQVAAKALENNPKRRIIVIMSDGRDTISQSSLSLSLKQAQRADAVIYAVNTSGKPASANVRELAGERALEMLSNETGGEVFFPDELADLGPVFSRLAQQLRFQYILGFSSSNEARDGTFRRLTVRVKRAGLYARARAGYYAPGPGPPQ